MLAPAGCTGYPGAVGDSILQSSLATSLLDPRYFPNIETVVWFGAPVAKALFAGRELPSGVDFRPWNGSEESLTEVLELESDFELACLCVAHPQTFETTLREARSMQDARVLTPSTALDPHSDIHLIEQLHSCLNVLEIPGARPPFPAPRLVPTEQEFETTLAKLNAIGFSSDGFFVCSIAAGDPEKRWGCGQWTDLIAGLLPFGAIWIWHGPAVGEPELAAAIHGALMDRLPDSLHRKIHVASTELRELAVLAKLAKICIAVDGGPTHVMAAAGGVVVNMVSKMNPKTWAPVSDRVVQLGQWKTPLNALSPQIVLETCERLLTGSAAVRAGSQSV